MSNLRQCLASAGLALMLSGSIAEAQTVHVVLLLPAGRPTRAEHVNGLDAAVPDLQAWYQRQLGENRTFRLDPTGVLVLQSTHTEDWFRSNPNSWHPFSRFYANALADVESILGKKLLQSTDLVTGVTTGDVWLISVDADHACGQCGGCGGGGVVVGARNDLRVHTGEPFVPICPGDFEPTSVSRPCRAAGGMGHELGHALGLLHPSGCDAGAASCDRNALMWLGYSTYGNTYLRPDEKAFLLSSPFSSRFFEIREALNPLLACHATSPGAVPVAPTALNVVVNGGSVTLRWNASASALGYVLEAGSAPGRTDLFNSDIGNITSLSAAPPAGTYFVRVRSRGLAGTSNPSNEVSFQVGAAPCSGAPLAPVGFTYSKSGLNVQFTWNAVVGSTSYVLEAGSAPGLADLFSGQVGGGTSFSATAPAGTYFVRVRASNACGTGAVSNEVLVTVP